MPEVTWDETQPCQICEGKGWVYVEDPTSQAQTDWATCGYCHGTGHSAWVVEKREARRARSKKMLMWLSIITVVLLASNQHQVSPVIFAIKVALWLPLLAAWLWWAVNRPVSQRARRRATRHAPGFSSGKEALAVGAVLGGAFLKAGHDARIRRQQAQWDRIEQAVKGPGSNPRTGGPW